MCIDRLTVNLLILAFVTGRYIVARGELNCTLSLTTVNGKPACAGELIFEDNFDTVNRTKWKQIVQFSSEPDYEFSVYHAGKYNTYVQNNVLHLKPTIKNLIVNRIVLKNCTGMVGTEECERTRLGFNYVPPAESGRITTRDSFSFKYGTIQIKAKMPLGDWIFPELWLLPKLNTTQGDVCYRFGRIKIATARGNRILKCDKRDIGNQFMEGDVTVGEQDCRGFRTKGFEEYNTKPWSEDFHLFTLIWTEDNISFLVDGANIMNSVIEKDNDTIRNVLGLSDIYNETKMSPFDKEFYLHLGVSVGGMTMFPDGCISGNTKKPWTNYGAKALMNFWNSRHVFNETWVHDGAALKIKSISVTAL